MVTTSCLQIPTPANTLTSPRGAGVPSPGPDTPALGKFLVALFISGPVPSDNAEKLVRHLGAAIDHVRRKWSQMPLSRVRAGRARFHCQRVPSHLNRLFQLEFGVSAVSALERLRCPRAETLLVRRDMTISSMGYQSAR
jgi:hypothetical protein